MLTELLASRRLPALRSREEMLELLQREEYGYLPKRPEVLTFRVEKNTVMNFCAGKATLDKVTAEGTVAGKPFSFPFYVTLPTAAGKHPFFVHINFRPDVPDRYMPTEELIDNGFAVLSFCYKDVTSDDRDFENGLAATLYEGGRRAPTDAGKIAMWAWASHRVLDYAETIAESLDFTAAVVCGHSRLGKTALFAAATDPRFTHAYSNDSGCSGAAISRGKQGETPEAIYRVFPHWFCENFEKYGNREDEMPFDQHYLIAAIAPRPVLVGSATEDDWADPLSEMLSCIAASPAFARGLVFEDRMPTDADAYLEGDVGYHLRRGRHYFSREDWARLIRFVSLHR